MSSVNFNLTTNFQYAAVTAELQTFGSRINRAIAREVIPPAERLLSRLMTKLRKVPRRRRWQRGDWSNDPEADARGRRAFFYYHPEARNGGYRRTNKLPEAWQGEITMRQATVEIEVFNPAKAASFVYGSEPFEFKQSPGHARTGWLNTGKEVPEVVLETGIEVERLTGAVADREVTRILR